MVTERGENGFHPFSMSIARGEICAIQTDFPADASTLLKSLATLLYPLGGTYAFMNRVLDFTDYRSLLPVKKRIGYVGTDAAMISNLTIEDNLLLMRHYDENSLNLKIEGSAAEYVKRFGLVDVLDMRPGEVAPPTLRLAILVRELGKSPDLLLLEYPEDYIGQANMALLRQVLGGMPLTDMVTVTVSGDNGLIDGFANAHISIRSGNIEKA